MASKLDYALIGKWRIVSADLWDRDYLDLIEPAYITFQGDGHGEFAFGAVNGGLDCEYSHRIIFFSWLGFDEMDEVYGDGSADLNDNGILEIEIRFHHGDEAQLTARPW